MIKIMRYGQVPNSEIFARGIDQANVEDIVTDILADVKMNGDEALRSYCRKFDGFTEDEFALEVSEAEFDAAFEAVGPRFWSGPQQISVISTKSRCVTASSSAARTAAA